MKILVIRFSSMGDVILATALLEYLAQHQPDAEVHLLTDTRYADFFRDDRRLASVTGIAKGDSVERLSSLARQKWDRVVDLQNSRRSKGIRRRLFAGIPTGEFDKLHNSRFRLLAFRRNRYDPELDVAARYVAAGRGSAPPRDEIPPPALRFLGDGGRVSAVLRATDGLVRPMLALVPYSAWKNKQWPAARFRTVGAYFQAKGWTVVIFGGPGDKADARRLAESIGGNCVSVAGEGSLYEAGCLMRRCRMAFGNDTGLIHLARACGLKTGVVYGSTTRQFGFYPYGEPPYKVYEARLWCRPCHAHGGNLCWRLTRPCLGRISAQEVIAGLEDLLRGSRAREITGK